MFKITYINVKSTPETLFFTKISSPEHGDLILNVKNLLIDQHNIGKITSYTSSISPDGLTITSEFIWSSEQDYLNFISNNAQTLANYSNARSLYNANNNITLTKTTETI